LNIKSGLGFQDNKKRHTGLWCKEPLKISLSLKMWRGCWSDMMGRLVRRREMFAVLALLALEGV
jgi:hypothetical protein